MKKLSLLLCLILILSFASACSRDETPESSEAVGSGSGVSAESAIDVSEETSEEEFIMNYWVFGEGADSAVKVSEGDFIKASEIDEALIKSRSGGYTYLSVKSDFFEIGGITHPDDNGGEFYRLDVTKKSEYSAQNSNLGACTAGATVRFRTNASSLKFEASLRGAITGMNHFTNRGVYGFDVYTGTGTNKIYCGGSMQMFVGTPSSCTETITLPGGYQELQINLPLYAGVTDIIIGVPDNAEIALPTPRDYLPIAFYGSSITQGGCVSRPGNMYSNIICRALNADNLNLGFSGSALGEQSVAEYLGTREISAFVMDYDFNSASADTLLATHYDFYKTVRDSQPDIPIIFVTHPYYAQENSGNTARKNVIKATYNKALQSGDDNVYYVDSEGFFTTQMRDLYAVDNLHPNDLGHFFMASAIFPVLKEALNK